MTNIKLLKQLFNNFPILLQVNKFCRDECKYFGSKFNMKLNLEKNNSFNVLTIADERIDAHNSVELKAYLLQLIDSGETNIVVQLAQVRFIDSSGLGALLAGHKHMLAKAGQFALANIQPQVLSMFELTRLNRVFDIYADFHEVLIT